MFYSLRFLGSFSQREKAGDEGFIMSPHLFAFGKGPLPEGEEK